MRTFRFVDVRRNAHRPRGFYHFVFENESLAFELAKRVLLGIQQGRLPRVKPREVLEGICGFVNLAWARFVRHRLHVERKAPVRLRVDFEQWPDPRNRIELSNDVDRWGRPRARIHWEIRENDWRSLNDLSKDFFARWPGDRCSVPEVRALVPGTLGRPYDVYHPVGTCRMGTDAEAVVDFRLLVRGTSNLFALTTAVFPSAGSANPTFTLLCLAGGLAEDLSHGGAED